MITLKEWMELVDYKITEGSNYGWQCYGYDVYSLDSWNGNLNGHSFTVIFDTKDQTVYEVQAHDYIHNRAYRMINPEYRDAHDDEALSRGVRPGEAWDEVDYIDLEVDDDFMQKCLAIKDGEDYDTRVQVPVDFTDEDLLAYMKLAHERDITFNQLVEQALREAINEYERDPEDMKQRAQRWKDEKGIL
jgi:hypothetical protein